MFSADELVASDDLEVSPVSRHASMVKHAPHKSIRRLGRVVSAALSLLSQLAILQMFLILSIHKRSADVQSKPNH
jgi:hypothetical protein